jgi:putative MFS transporter
MPNFWWNVGMCFLMGASAGGMLPVSYALLAEIMPTRHRGWSLVLVGGLGAVGGYFAASFLSAVLQPLYGWRVMWLLNLPTGLIIVALSGLLPESARFLQHMGRHQEARAALARFGAVVAASPPAREPEDIGHAYLPPTALAQAGLTAALTLAALSWGLVNFGLLLWLPSALVREGFSVVGASELIAMSSAIALPVVLFCSWLYSQWSTKWALGATLTVIAIGLVLVLLREAAPLLASPLMSTALLVIGSTGAISILLPYTAECYPLRIRGRASGWVAGCSKLGGLIAQGASLVVGLPPLGLAASLIAAPAVTALALIGVFGVETRGRDLRLLERPPATTPR